MEKSLVPAAYESFLLGVSRRELWHLTEGFVVRGLVERLRPAEDA